MIRNKLIRKSKRDDKITENLVFLYHFDELINFCTFSKKYINKYVHFPRVCVYVCKREFRVHFSTCRQYKYNNTIIHLS